MSGLVSLVRVMFFALLFSPIIIRYIIIKRPASERVGSLLAIGYAVGCYFLITLVSTLRMIAYLNQEYGSYNDISPIFRSNSVNIVMIFWEAVFSSILAALLFYFARFILRKGHAMIESQDVDREVDRPKGWWSSIGVRQIVFLGAIFIIIYMFKVFEVASTQY